MIFDVLINFKDEIESRFSDILKKFNALFQWDRLPEKRASRIRITLEGINCYEKQNWNEAFNFITETSIKLQEVFLEYLKKIHL